jgi:hypothetical protein
MRLNRRCLTAVFAIGCAASAGAAPVHYEGALQSGVAVTGSVGGFGWSDESATQVDFWSFSALAGAVVDVSAARLAPDLDPVFSVYVGTTAADGSEFRSEADWGGLRYLTYADDEVPADGPGGDPALIGFVLPQTGNYTIVVGGFASTDLGPYGYRLDYAVRPVPEPAPALLFVAGLAMLVLRRRR